MAYVVTVYEGNIVRMIQVGDGATWTRQRAWEIRQLAVIRAPLGLTGELKAKHRVEQNRDVYTGRYRKGFNIVADARHAAAVHGGTAANGTGYIYPKTKKALAIPAGNGHGPKVVRRVRGQRANPWLRRAGETVAKRY
jgi:hypothetical protein